MSGMTTIVNLSDARRRPVARLTRITRRGDKGLLGAFAGKIHMADDFDEIPGEFKPCL